MSTRSTTLDLVERGLKGIRDVVRAALMSYRAERDERPLSRDDIEDLKLLISPEARRRGVLLQWRNELTGQVALPANTVRQIILNLVLNACQAAPQESWAAVSVAETPGGIVLQVEDVGPGMPTAALAMLTGAADRPAPIGHGTDDVALGDDPGQLVAVQDDQGADVLVLQPVSNLVQAVVGRSGDRARTAEAVHRASDGPGRVQGHRGHLTRAESCR